jgi:predicted amidohydrolase
MRLLLAQRAHKYYDKEYNFNIMRDTLKSTDADLVVFPELFLTGYRIRDKVIELSEPLNGDYVTRLSEQAKRTKRAIIFGMPERDTVQKGRIFNSAVYISKSGDVSAYRKFFPVNFGPFEEKRYFHKGADLPILEVDNVKFGIIICYDIFFPELAKSYALRGADMIVCISASPSITRKFFEIMITARAVESTVFFAYANLIGPEKNMTFWGGDTIMGPRGDQLAKGKYFEEDDVVADIDVSELDLARTKRPTLRDSRIDLFESLIETMKPKTNE